MTNNNSLKCIASAVTVLALAACSGGGGGGAAGGGGNVVTNIVGKVSTSSTSSVRGKPGFFASLYQKVVAFTSTPSGCTAYAYDLNGSTILAQATVASDGSFTISSGSLSAGSSYKVVTSCTDGTKLSAVLGADATAPDSKAPATVNPVTTLIATQIVKAIVTAVQTATQGLPQAAQAAIKAALLDPKVLSNIVTTVTNTIQQAIDYGSMNPPSVSAAASMTDAVKTTTDSNTGGISAAETAYTNDGNAIPPAVSASIASSAKSAAALPACDRSLQSHVDNNGAPIASVSLCTQAVAKLLYNDVHFSVGLKTSGGAFGNIACNSNDTTLAAAFPNASFKDHNSDNDIPTGMCVVINSTPSLDRNRSYDSQGGGDHDEMVFFETFTANSTTYEGVVTAMATALYNNYQYRLSDLDRLVFGYDSGTGAGMNARVLYQNSQYSFSVNNGSSQTRSYQLLSTNGTTNSAANWSGGSWPSNCYGGSSVCNPGDGQSVFPDIHADWSNASANGTLATAIGASSWTGSVFLLNYGGPIPSADTLKNQIVNSTAHADYNRTGQPKFNVLYAKQPDWNNPNCQWGSSPTSYTQTSTGVTSTKCLSMDGTEEPAVRVNLTFGTPNGTTGISQIATIMKSNTGRYFLIPQSPNGAFTGLFQFLDSVTGRVVTDESFHQRAAFVVTDDTTQCGQNGVPSSCANGEMYNTSMSWNCSGNSCTISYNVGSAQQTKINDSHSSDQYTLTVRTNLNQIWSMNGPGVVGAGRSDGQNYGPTGPAFKAIFVSTIDATTGAVTATTNASSTGSATPGNGQYAIQGHWSCTGNPVTCTQSGYWLVDSTGTPFQASGTLDTGLAASSDQWCAQGGGGCIHPTEYPESYFQGAGNIFHYADNNNATSWAHAATTIQVDSGPAANPTFDCSQDPYFVDANNNGKLDHTTNPTTGQVTCTETTFNGGWDAAQYIAGQGPYQNPQGGHCSYYSVNPALCGAHQGATIAINRDNAYVYGDPTAVTSLLQKAFGPMMDGKHTLTATTNLNALQAFGLVYILMSQHTDDGTHISGLLPDLNGRPRDTFSIATPVCNGDPKSCNAAIGKAFLNFRQ